MTWASRAKAEFGVKSVDLARLEAISEFDESSSEKLLIEVVALYLEIGPKLMAQLKKGTAAKNVREIHTSVHSLKSSSANVGALSLESMCQFLEDSTDPDTARTMQDFAGMASDIEHEFQRVCRDLEIILKLAQGGPVPEKLVKAS